MIKNILYIESNIDNTIGGSYFSLLFLIKNINRNKYYPIIVFYTKNSLFKEFEISGSKVVLFKKNQPTNLEKITTKHFYRKSLNDIVSYFFLSLQKFINFFTLFVFPSVKCIIFLHKEKIDLIHLNNTLKRPPEWIIASIFSRAKIIAHERGINPTFSTSEKFLSRFLKAIICISASVKYNLITHGFPIEKLFLIYNGLDPQFFTITKEKSRLLEEFQLDEYQPLIGIIGNIKQWKGQETIVRAMIHIKTVMPNVRCLLVGDAPKNSHYFSHLKSLIHANQLDDRILMTGHRKDIPDIINILSILIHTSVLPEPFGRVLLEGMALEKPVITTNIGAGPEIVVDGETGILVPPGDDKALAEAILSLLNDPEKAYHMGKAGRKRLENNFHIDSTTQLIENLYGNII